MMPPQNPTAKRKLILIALLALFVGASAFWLERARAVPAGSMYGAGAYDDSTGSYGYSYNYASQSEANHAALRQCRNSGCSIRVEFADACGAFAKDSSGGPGYGWGIAATSAAAQNRALSECQLRGGYCYVAVWGCTSR